MIKNKVGRPKKQYTKLVRNGMGRRPRTLETLPNGWQKKMIELSKSGYFEVELRVHALNMLPPAIWYRWLDEEEEFKEIVDICKELRSAFLYQQGRLGLYNRDFRDSHWNRLMMNTQESWSDKSSPNVNINMNHDGSQDVSDRIRELIKNVNNA